ncbi:MAG: Rieske 2Fe-2S domain-containing protein, partial [Pseudomonadota bacterium]
MSDWVSVARADELAPGQWKSVDVDGAQVAVFNLGGQYYAIEDVCTH